MEEGLNQKFNFNSIPTDYDDDTYFLNCEKVDETNKFGTKLIQRIGTVPYIPVCTYLTYRIESFVCTYIRYNIRQYLITIPLKGGHSKKKNAKKIATKG